FLYILKLAFLDGSLKRLIHLSLSLNTTSLISKAKLVHHKATSLYSAYEQQSSYSYTSNNQRYSEFKIQLLEHYSFMLGRYTMVDKMELQEVLHPYDLDSTPLINSGRDFNILPHPLLISSNILIHLCFINLLSIVLFFP
ncbi:hypothetical protein AABB24_030172, partial [Solanum stoloniferum]